VSGYIVAPPQCGAGISARACQRCLASKAPEPCLACAKSPQLKSRLLDTVLGGMSPADGCGACYTSTAPDSCTACLYGKKPCAECALQPENPETQQPGWTWQPASAAGNNHTKLAGCDVSELPSMCA
jgi:hypothetical protein